MARARVLVAGLGDSGLLTAIHLARHRDIDVVGVSSKPGLVSGQELGMRLARPEEWARDYRVGFERFRRLDGVRTIDVEVERHPVVAVPVQVRIEVGAGGDPDGDEERHPDGEADRHVTPGRPPAEIPDRAVPTDPRREQRHAERREVVAQRLGVLGHVRQRRAQILQVQQGKMIVIAIFEENGQNTCLGFGEGKDAGEQYRPEFTYSCLQADSRLLRKAHDLHGRSLRREIISNGFMSFLQLFRIRGRFCNAADVALDIHQEDRDPLF